MLNVGKYKEKIVTTNDSELTNRHVCVIGESGSGKTVECQRLIASAIENGATIVAFDMHGTLADDQIFWKYKPVFEKYERNVNAQMEGIPCNLFTPATYPDGTSENNINVIGSITEVIAEAINAGSTQRSELRRALQYISENGDYERYGFGAVDIALRNARNRHAETVREKLFFLTAHNVFVSGDEFIHRNHINIFRLSRFDLKTQQLVAEIILAYLWRLANAEEFKVHPIYIFVDECQNMPAGKNNALAQMLSEGRKFGVNLILATQILAQGNTSALQQRITQCGVKLYFKPASNKVSMTARMIDPLRESDWCRLLKTLGIGEFIADGNFLVDGRERNEPLKVSAYEEKEASESESEGDIKNHGRGSVVCYW